MTPKDEKTYLIEKGDVISSDETFFGNAWSNLNMPTIEHCRSKIQNTDSILAIINSYDKHPSTEREKVGREFMTSSFRKNNSEAVSKVTDNLNMKKLGTGVINQVFTQNFPKTNISNLLIHTRTCAYQGVRNVSFSEDFAYVLNGWPQNSHIPSKTIKSIKYIIAPFMPENVNSSDDEGEFPNGLKHADIVPVLKKKSKIDKQTTGQFAYFQT